MPSSTSVHVVLGVEDRTAPAGASDDRISIESNRAELALHNRDDGRFVLWLLFQLPGVSSLCEIMRNPWDLTRNTGGSSAGA